MTSSPSLLLTRQVAVRFSLGSKVIFWVALPFMYELFAWGKRKRRGRESHYSLLDRVIKTKTLYLIVEVTEHDNHIFIIIITTVLILHTNIINHSKYVSYVYILYSSCTNRRIPTPGTSLTGGHHGAGQCHSCDINYTHTHAYIRAVDAPLEGGLWYCFGLTGHNFVLSILSEEFRQTGDHRFAWCRNITHTHRHVHTPVGQYRSFSNVLFLTSYVLYRMRS